MTGENNWYISFINDVQLIKTTWNLIKILGNNAEHKAETRGFIYYTLLKRFQAEQ